MLTLFFVLAYATSVHGEDHISLLQRHMDSGEEFIAEKIKFREERWGPLGPVKPKPPPPPAQGPPPVPVLGDKGTNSCPPGSFKSPSEKDCERLASTLGYNFTAASSTKFQSVRPGGCYANKKKKAFFNPTDGAAFKKATPVCMKPPAAPQTTTRRPPQTTTPYRRPPQTTTPYRRPPQTTTPYRRPQTTTPYRAPIKRKRNVCTVLKCKKKDRECCFVPVMQNGRKVYGRRGEWSPQDPNQKAKQDKCIKKMRGQWCDTSGNIYGPALPPLPERKRTVCTVLKCKKKGNECCFVPLMQKGRKVYGRRGEWSPQDPTKTAKQNTCIKKGGAWCDKDLNEHKKAKVVKKPHWSAFR